MSDTNHEEVNPLVGKRSLKGLLESTKVKNPGKGYNSLMEGIGLASTPSIKNTKKIETVTTEYQNFDPMIMNEILRVVVEKRNKLDHLELDIKELKKKQLHYKHPMILIGATVLILLGFFMGYTSSDPVMAEPIIKEQTIVDPDQAIVKKSSKFVTTKFVNLRARGLPTGKLITTLRPGSVLKELSKKQGWIKVEFRDYIKGRTLKGWLWHEYLKQI